MGRRPPNLNPNPNPNPHPHPDQENASEGPLALIMAPTRELVQQIEDETRKFAGELKIRVYSVVGGLSIEEQSFITSQGTECMVATG